MLAKFTAGAQNPRPNIIVILADDLNQGILPEYGNNFLNATHIQALRNEGILFRNSFVVQSLCAPSRATLMTGEYPHVHGVTDNANHDTLIIGIPTIQKTLQDSGYYTGFVGKMHVQGNGETGFDYRAIVDGSAPYYNTVFHLNGHDTILPGYIAGSITDYSLDFLHTRDTSRPFFLVVAHKNPHDPTIPEPAFSHYLDSATIPLPVTWNEDICDKPGFMSQLSWNPLTAHVVDSLIRSYYNCAMSVDKSVGVLIDSLSSEGLLDNTLIIFTSDNGLLHGEHHGMKGKRVSYDESLKVPMIIRFPAWFAAGAIDSTHMVLNLDLAPTILDAAGLPMLGQFQGHSIHTILNGANLHDTVLFEDFPGTTDVMLPFKAIRTSHWKFTRYHCASFDNELYDLLNDPFETTNQIRNPVYYPVLLSLDSLLNQKLIEYNDPASACSMHYSPYVYGCDTSTRCNTLFISASQAMATWCGEHCPERWIIQWRDADSTQWQEEADTTAYHWITGLHCNTFYQWRVRSVCTPGDSSQWNMPQTFRTLCETPAGFTAMPLSANSEFVSWNNSACAVKYKIQYRIAGTSTWTIAFTTTAVKTFTGLLPATTYEMQVKNWCSISAYPQSAWSTVFSFTTPCMCTMPGAPVGISNLTSSSVSLSWGMNSCALKYHIQYRKSGAAVWKNIYSSSSPRTIGLLLSNTSYEFRIRSECDSAGTYISEWTPTQSFATYPTCNIPTGISISSITSSSAILQWNNISGVTGYTIGYRKSNSSNWTNLTSSINSITFSNLLSNTNYQYRLKTNCSSGLSSFYSSIGNFTTLIPRLKNPQMLVDTVWQVAPNPVQNELVLSSGNYSDATASVIITDIIGRRLFSALEFLNGTRLDVSEWPSGIYFIWIGSEGKSQELRFVKQ